jgi:hypothetical protein
MILNEIQIKLIKGEICQYCKNKTQYIDSSVIYGKSYGMIYLCKPCDAYCGVHKGTNNSLGIVANKELRYWKKQAHYYFDLIWKEKHETRSNLYQHLSKHLNIPIEYTHIGMFSIKTCKEVIDYSKMILNDLRRLDLDFGIDVKRKHFNR